MRTTAKCMVTLTLTALAAAASAQNYPSKSIRFLVGFAPGGSTDIVARLIAQKMTDNVGQQVVVDNRAGAGGIIAAEILAKSPPDGYTILACTTGNFAIIPYLYKTVPYNADKDLLPVTQSGSLPYIIVVHPSLPVKNVKELIAFAKSHPGQINYHHARRRRARRPHRRDSFVAPRHELHRDRSAPRRPRRLAPLR
jgi:tripartite-type tricarboxylate transporter receptor subunit TctC